MDAGMTDAGMTDTGAADAGVAAAGMHHPRRQAALAAMDNIRRLREWEEMNETSNCFRECVSQIDSEFRAEEKQRRVRSEDLDSDGENEAEFGASQRPRTLGPTTAVHFDFFLNCGPWWEGRRVGDCGQTEAMRG